MTVYGALPVSSLHVSIIISQFHFWLRAKHRTQPLDLWANATTISSVTIDQSMTRSNNNSTLTLIVKTKEHTPSPNPSRFLSNDNHTLSATKKPSPNYKQKCNTSFKSPSCSSWSGFSCVISESRSTMTEIRTDNNIQFAWSAAFASADAQIASRAAKYAAAAATTAVRPVFSAPAPERAIDRSSYDVYAALGSWPVIVVFAWYFALGLTIELHNGMPFVNWLLCDTLCVMPRVDWYGLGLPGPNWNDVGRAFGALSSGLISGFATFVCLAAKLLGFALFTFWSVACAVLGVAGDVVMMFAMEIVERVVASPLISLVRLRLRLGRNWICNNFARALLVLAALALLAMWTGEKAPGTSTPALEVREYHIPEYFILAQPQNRPRDGSSSHYKAASEPIYWATTGESDILIETLPATEVETATRTESTTMTPLATADSATAGVATAWHTESTTAQLLATAGSATASVPVQRVVGGMAYCQQCRQRHCCEVVD